MPPRPIGRALQGLDAKRFRAYFADDNAPDFNSAGMLPSTGNAIWFTCVKHRINPRMWLAVFLIAAAVVPSAALVAA